MPQSPIVLSQSIMDPSSTTCWHEQKRGKIDAKITELIVKKENLRQEEMQIEEKLEKIEEIIL